MNRLTMIYCAAGFLGMLFLMWSGPAKAASECRALDDILAEAQAHEPSIELDVMTPEASSLYIEEARRVTPATRLRGHVLAIFSSRRLPSVVIVGMGGDRLVCTDSAITRASLSLHMLVMRRIQRMD